MFHSRPVERCVYVGVGVFVLFSVSCVCMFSVLRIEGKREQTPLQGEVLWRGRRGGREKGGRGGGRPEVVTLAGRAREARMGCVWAVFVRDLSFSSLLFFISFFFLVLFLVFCSCFFIWRRYYCCVLAAVFRFNVLIIVTKQIAGILVFRYVSGAVLSVWQTRGGGVHAPRNAADAWGEGGAKKRRSSFLVFFGLLEGDRGGRYVVGA